MTEELPVYRRRRPGQWVLTLVVVLLAASLVQSLITNRRFGWDTVGAWLFSRTVMTGLLTTLELTAAAMAIGLVLGIALALMRLSDNPVARTVSWAYIWLFRGTPLLVQLLFWGFISALYPTLSLHLPLLPAIGGVPANSVITTFAAALLGLGLNEAAYLAEIIRAGIVSVDPGQLEAADALGLSRARTLRRIVLPQAMRVILPPVGNETISMLKTTSLVSVLAYAELLYSVQIVYARTYQTIPLLIVASIWYLAVTTLLDIGQHYLERHFAKGSSR
ncbi:amino acid ABC transporter permease [Streptomyces sasae]|uniref:amino acid ABC transporter permease n=1 Tax=Streptomyces sasae TaxID=1266772 RepID=UPI00292F7EE2|nr:amino acid ABC transporter permease [Streptomyces sasae]